MSSRGSCLGGWRSCRSFRSLTWGRTSSQGRCPRSGSSLAPSHSWGTSPCATVRAAAQLARRNSVAAACLQRAVWRTWFARQLVMPLAACLVEQPYKCQLPLSRSAALCAATLAAPADLSVPADMSRCPWCRLPDRHRARDMDRQSCGVARPSVHLPSAHAPGPGAQRLHREAATHQGICGCGRHAAGLLRVVMTRLAVCQSCTALCYALGEQAGCAGLGPLVQPSHSLLHVHLVHLDMCFTRAGQRVLNLETDAH